MTPALKRHIPSVHTDRLNKGAGGVLFFINQRPP